jgi:O-antigen/teichoic acid export membrane protein
MPQELSCTDRTKALVTESASGTAGDQGKDVLTKDAKSVRGSFISNVAAVLGGQAACAAVALATEICYARLLGPGGRGQISLCLMAIAFGVLAGGMGGEGTIILWSADPRRRSTVWLPAVLLWGLLGCILTCSLWGVVYWKWHPTFLRSINPTLAVIVLLSIPAGVLLDYQIGMFVGEERFRTRASVAIAAQAGGLAGFAVLLFFGRSAENALWGNLLGILAGGGIAAAILTDSFRGFWRLGAARNSLLPTLSFAMRGHFGNVASFFNYRLDVFVVNYYLDSTQVGLYALGVVISEALWQIPGAAAVALFPRTARTIDEGATNFTCLIMRQVLLIATVSAIAIAIGSWLFLPLIFGERFRPSIAVVWLLLPGTLALSLGRVGVSDLAGRGKSGYSSVFSLSALVVTIALDLILIPRMGIQGASLASSAAYLTNTILILAALKYELKVTWRSLLVPTYAELASYQHAWSRFREWMKPATALPSS